MDKLCFDVYVTALSWLDVDSLLSVGRCSRWTHRVMKKPEAWRTVAFHRKKGRVLRTNDMARLTSSYTETIVVAGLFRESRWDFLRQCTGLKTFFLSWAKDFDYAVLSQLPRLQAVWLRNVENLDLNTRGFQPFPSLCRLSLKGSRVRDLTSLAVCPRIAELNLVGCKGVCTFVPLSHMKCLKTLTIDPHHTMLSSFSPGLSFLETVVLSRYGLDDSDYSDSSSDDSVFGEYDEPVGFGRPFSPSSTPDVPDSPLIFSPRARARNSRSCRRSFDYDEANPYLRLPFRSDPRRVYPDPNPPPHQSCDGTPDSTIPRRVPSPFGDLGPRGISDPRRVPSPFGDPGPRENSDPRRVPSPFGEPGRRLPPRRKIRGPPGSVIPSGSAIPSGSVIPRRVPSSGRDPGLWGNSGLRRPVSRYRRKNPPSPFRSLFGSDDESSCPDDSGLLYHCPRLRTAHLEGSNRQDVSWIMVHQQLEELFLDRNQGLVDITPLQYGQELKDLSLSFCGVKDIGPLAHCHKLQYLSLCKCPVDDLFPLAGCRALRSLNLTDCVKVQSLLPLSACRNLERLNVSGWTHLSDVSPIAGLVHLKILEVKNCGILTLSPLLSCVDLEEIDAEGCVGLRELAASDANTNWPRLKRICVNKCYALQRLGGLASCLTLREVNAAECPNLRGLSGLSGCVNVEYVNVLGGKRLSDISVLATFRRLNSLNLENCVSLRHVVDLSLLDRLEFLNVGGCVNLCALPKVVNWPSLMELFMYDTSVQSLEPLENNCGRLACLDVFGTLGVQNISQSLLKCPNLKLVITNPREDLDALRLAGIEVKEIKVIVRQPT